jgi:SAM-dependent methyltransferase
VDDWTSGYVADVAYTYGYYPELNPVRVRLALLSAGIAAPEIGTACELGFGQGISVGVHAAAGPAGWWGTDFNPAQAGFAQELARASGSNAQLSDEAFAEFCGRADLPDFDFISLHGIWSWISDENRRVIVEFVRRKLKVGGVLYISYNTLPGWSGFGPMRHLMARHAETLGAPGAGVLKRADGALDFAEKLLATKPMFLKANPQAAERLKQVVKQDRHYVAHEYFNRHWQPMFFTDVRDWLEPAKVDFACSATWGDHVEAINMTPEQQALLKEIPNADLRQMARDFMVNQQFRRDYWVKGVRRLAPMEQAEQLRAARFLLTTPRADVPTKVQGGLGEAALNANVYGPLLDLMADHKPHTLAAMEAALQPRGIAFAQVLQAMQILIHANQVMPVQDEAAAAKSRKSSDALNRHFLQRSRSHTDMNYAASPVLGGGYPIGRIPALFASAMAQGKKQPKELAAAVWPLMAAQGQKVLKDGKPLISAEENLAELEQIAVSFTEKRLPILKALQIA